MRIACRMQYCVYPLQRPRPCAAHVYITECVQCAQTFTVFFLRNFFSTHRTADNGLRRLSIGGRWPISSTRTVGIRAYAGRFGNDEAFPTRFSSLSMKRSPPERPNSSHSEHDTPPAPVSSADDEATVRRSMPSCRAIS